MVEDGLLVVAPWPAGVRKSNNDRGYLVALNEGERLAYEATGNLPEEARK